SEPRGSRIRGTAQGNSFSVLTEAAPRGVILGENLGQLILVGDHVQAMRPRRKRLSFHADIVPELDGRVLIRPCPPYLAVGHDFVPNFTATHRRPVITNVDVRQSDSLRYRSALANPRNIQFRRLTSILELCLGGSRQQARPQEQTQNVTKWIAHKHTFSSASRINLRVHRLVRRGHPIAIDDSSGKE